MRPATALAVIAMTCLTGFAGGAFLGALPNLSGDSIPQYICENLRSHVWSPVRGTCITPTCYTQGTCGLRSFPAAACHRVIEGDHISRVIMLLGDPRKQNNQTLIWPRDKTDGGFGVLARFEDDRLVELYCPAQPD